MKTIIKFLLLCCVALVLEFTMTKPTRSVNFAPQLPLLAVLFAALRWKETTGALLGFCLGILYAGLFGEPLGLSSLTFSLVGYLAGKTAPFIKESPRFILFFFALIMLLWNHILAGLILLVFYGRFFRCGFFGIFIGALVFAAFLPGLLKIFRGSRRLG